MSTSIRPFATSALACYTVCALVGVVGSGALVAGCAHPGNIVQIVPKKDIGIDDDLAGADLLGADLSGPNDMGSDMPAGDMARPWTDKSVTIPQDLYSVWSNGATVWATGSTYNSSTSMATPNTGAIYKSTSGGAFTLDASAMPSGTPNLISIASYGTGPTLYPLLAVGSAGTIWSNNGTAWTADTSSNVNALYGVWVAPDTNAWTVGLATAIKRVGSTWGSVSGISNTDSAFNVWGIQTGTGTYSIYAVGALGKIWHSTGGDFDATTQTSGTTNALYGVWGSSATDIYAVGDHGIILHSTGNGVWTTQVSGVETAASDTTNDIALEAIGGASADEIYIGGDKGTVLLKNGASSTTWLKQTIPATINGAYFLGVWASTKTVYITGTTGAILRR